MEANYVDISTRQKFEEMKYEAGQIFNPHSPVSEKDLFSGRKSQITRVLDVISQRGLHAIIYGERGVGKSSLANVLAGFFPPGRPLSATRINCDSDDTFLTVWSKIFDSMQLSRQDQSPGFQSEKKSIPYNAKSIITSDENVPEQVRRGLINISQVIVPVLIIDEFDRLDESVRRLFADFIKGLSDYSINVTIILVGVGASVDDLIKEHESLARNLKQIQMPRMNATEIEGVITKALQRLGMTISGNVLNEIRIICKGLPHYAHLIGLHATRDALDKFTLNIDDSNYKAALQASEENANKSI
jgi:Cdc6-like AAA superfamily ATPase